MLALKAAGVSLTEMPEAALSLSTCVAGQQENVTAYKVGPGASFDFISTDGSVALSVREPPRGAQALDRRLLSRAWRSASV